MINHCPDFFGRSLGMPLLEIGFFKLETQINQFKRSGKISLRRLVLHD